MRRLSTFIAIVLTAAWLAPVSTRAQIALEVTCRADLPTHPGQSMTWRAFVNGAVGSPTYSWSGADGLSGTGAVTTHSYSSVGYVTAHVEVTDPGSNATTTADCAMHVIPVSFVETPSVTPVLWVPAGIDPAPLVPELKRVWRAIHATFFHFYGKTFLMRPFTTVVSTATEADLCGGDCTNAGKADIVANRALSDADAAIGGTIPYTRAMLVMAWGAGGWAGAWSWDIARGVIGDLAVAPAADVPIPSIEPDLPGWLVPLLGLYDYSVYASIAHELNHAVAWDDPHDFSLDNPPNDYEKAVSLAGPFLTRTLADGVLPSASFTQPAENALLSGKVDVNVSATDNDAMDAVLLLMDQHLVSIDRTAPFSFRLNTKTFGFGDHQLTAVALDRTGNMVEVTQNVHTENQIAGSTCDGRFPRGSFRACFYDGVGTNGPYLGTLLDHPFPTPTPNAGIGLNHAWGGVVAFGRADSITGVWRGRLDFPAATYLCRFFADDGLQVWIDGRLVVDAWRAPQVADSSAAVALDGPTPIKIRWFERDGSAGLRFSWSPTRQEPLPA
jgi:hypothetical protein